ncbi:hypothetical protein [Thermobacillus xylanilyticus]|jgi:hypothetical protein|uniref:hypothetical protein n=1 Tax=Thermobacillus xylanilyticus TaxID=76633 RepID=UPI001FD5D700|nr:hypothetical protein [Thermobacillus xylanilyticus]
MDNLVELATPFVMSVCIFCSIVMLTFARPHSVPELYACRREADAGATLLSVCRNTAINPIRRWIAGKAQRKEAPGDEEDTGCPLLHITKKRIREGNREKKFEASLAQAGRHRALCRSAALCARRVFGVGIQRAD